VNRVGATDAVDRKVVVDNTPPTGDISVPAYVSKPEVALNATASDATSGLAGLEIGNWHWAASQLKIETGGIVDDAQAKSGRAWHATPSDQQGYVYGPTPMTSPRRTTACVSAQGRRPSHLSRGVHGRDRSVRQARLQIAELHRPTSPPPMSIWEFTSTSVPADGSQLEFRTRYWGPPTSGSTTSRSPRSESLDICSWRCWEDDGVRRSWPASWTGPATPPRRSLTLGWTAPGREIVASP